MDRHLEVHNLGRTTWSHNIKCRTTHVAHIVHTTTTTIRFMSHNHVVPSRTTKFLSVWTHLNCLKYLFVCLDRLWGVIRICQSLRLFVWLSRLSSWLSEFLSSWMARRQFVWLIDCLSCTLSIFIRLCNCLHCYWGVLFSFLDFLFGCLESLSCCLDSLFKRFGIMWRYLNW